MIILKGRKVQWTIAGLLLFFAALSPIEGLCATGYFNLMGTRGIPTLGNADNIPYTNPTAGDNWSGIYRYIVPTDVTTTEGKYLLRYPLTLPQGATITSASVFVVLGANIDPGTNIKAFLRSKPWNASGNVTLHGSADAGGVNGQHTLVITPGTGLPVNNATTLYWVDVNIYNYIIPHFHGVYAVQVAYTYSGAGLFLPLIQKD